MGELSLQLIVLGAQSVGFFPANVADQLGQVLGFSHADVEPPVLGVVDSGVDDGDFAGVAGEHGALGEQERPVDDLVIGHYPSNP